MLGTDPQNSASSVGADFIAQTDLMFLYSQKFLDSIGDISPETHINQLVEVTNNYYANSGALVRFRPVFYGFSDYDTGNDLSRVMDAMSNATGVFSELPKLREKVGADITVFIDGLFPGGGACGLGTLPGVGFEGEIFHPLLAGGDLISSLYNAGFPAEGGAGCDDLTLAHELGHNHGLAHSRRESGAQGTYSWSFGHGVDGSFATIMATPDDYPGSVELPLFSNPLLNDCNGLACGVDRADSEQSADAVFTSIRPEYPSVRIANRKFCRLRAWVWKALTSSCMAQLATVKTAIRRFLVLAPATALMFGPRSSFPASIKESSEKPMS